MGVFKFPKATTLFATGIFAGGASSSIFINAPNDIFNNPMFTVLCGIDITAEASGTLVSGNVNVSDSNFPHGIQYSFPMSFGTSQMTQKTLIFPNPIISSLPGPNNFIALSFPAITGGPAYSLFIWGYAVYQNT